MQNIIKNGCAYRGVPYDRTDGLKSAGVIVGGTFGLILLSNVCLSNDWIRTGHFFNRHIRVNPMLIKEINGIHAEAFE